MVEKIIVNPDSIRGWGNIVMEHTVEDYSLVGSSILVDSDVVMGVESVVYTIEAEDTTISVALVSSVASCSIGDSIVLSATVTDDEEPVEGGTVTFKLGSSTTLGTDETDANGVATYTYTTTDVGSLNFTALYESHNSNTVSVVVSHDYSISFSQSSYTAVGGSAEISCTLTDNGVAVSGATVSFTGSDSSVYSGITNNDGVAQVTVNNVSGTVTFTGSYSNVSAQCTVTAQTYLFYDDCSVDSTSQYDTLMRYGGSNATCTVSFASQSNGYNWNGSGGDYFAGRVIPNTRGYDDIKITCKFYLRSSTAYNQLFIGVSDTLTGNSIYRFTADFFRARGDKQVDYLHNSDTEIWKKTNAMTFNGNWATIEFIKQGTSITGNVYNSSGTLVATTTQTGNSYSNPYYFIGVNCNNTTDTKYVKEIKAEAL